MKPKIIKLGSIYFDGKPEVPGSCFNKGALNFGDSVKYKKLEWVEDRGILYATACACFGISWDQLYDQGYIFGRTVNIDGKQYRCRCIKLWNLNSGEVGEWADLLNRYSNRDKLWHWKNVYFLGQEKEGKSVMLAGGRTSKGVSYHYSWFNDFKVGFRPVLEPVKDLLTLTKAVVGKRIAVCSNAGEKILGTVSGFDDYDLVLKTSSPLSSKFVGTVEKDGLIIVSRECPELHFEEASDDEP